ncbi:hypothetical protein REPUB_Repub15cG0021200 [Reevesia pubescens]
MDDNLDFPSDILNIINSEWDNWHGTLSPAFNNSLQLDGVEINLLTGETIILSTYIIYDCGQSLNSAWDLGQIEGAYVQGIGFFMLEEYPTNSDGLLIANGTWIYKSLFKQFRIPSGEPPLTLAVSVHCATRAAIVEARKQLVWWNRLDDESNSATFQLKVPATMPVVKEMCGFDNIQKFLQWTMDSK